MSIIGTAVRLRVLPALLPVNGRNVEIRGTDTAIEERLAGDADWNIIVEYSTLTDPILAQAQAAADAAVQQANDAAAGIAASTQAATDAATSAIGASTDAVAAAGSADADAAQTAADRAQTTNDAANAEISRIAAQAAQNASMVNAQTYATIEAGLAAATDGATFDVQGPTNTDFTTRYRRVGSAAVQIGVAASKRSIDRIDTITFGELQVAPISISGRMVIPTELSYDLYVLRGTYVDSGEAYDPRTVTTALQAQESLFVPVVTIGGRRVQPTLLSYDLYVLEGVYLDTGEPYGGVSQLDLDALYVVTTATQWLIASRIPTNANLLICQRMERVPNAAKNSDVWRKSGVFEASFVGGVLTLGTALTTAGAEETAIQISGAVDFAGDPFHGNQELTSIRAMVDRVAKTLGSTEAFVCRQVDFFQVSNLFKPGTTEGTKFVPKGTNFAKAYTRWTFTAGGKMLLRNMAEFLTAENLTITYLAMLPAQRVDGVTQVTTTALRMPDLREQDITTTTFSPAPYSDVSDEYLLWGDRYGLGLKMLKGFDKPNRSATLTNQPTQNKAYFNLTGTYLTTPGEKLEALAEFTYSLR